MIFDTTTPESWQDLSLHPFFEGKAFEENWYDGNLNDDLLRLRRACAAIVQAIPEFVSELIVLDDCTFFANFNCDGNVICELYPATTTSDEKCLFFTFPKFPDLEIRVLTDQKAVEVMLAFIRKDDLSRFDEIE